MGTSARIYRSTARNIAFLAAQLRAGELVAVPTETVYGLAADALNPAACARIFRAKGRPAEDPLIVHVHSRRELEELCHVNSAAERLAQKFWPGPLTLVLPKKPIIAPIITAGRASVAIRMPAHPVFRRLLRETGRPLAAPSANPFGYISPTTAQHVRDGLDRKIRYILDGGPAPIGLESTIVDLRDPARAVILRPGFITATAIARVLGYQPRRTKAQRHSAVGEASRGALAPGLLSRHYSPRTPLSLQDRLTVPARPNPRHAYLFLRRPTGKTAPNLFWLDAGGDLRAAARRLFGTLRKLDRMKFAMIHAERAAGGELADAINDRLQRASVR